MRNRTGQLLKIACLVLGALLLMEIVLAIVRSNPLAKVTVPAIPSLSADTNAPTESKATNSPPVRTAVKNGTNVQTGELAGSGTNPAPASASAKTGTNANSVAESAGAGTNAVPAPNPETEATNSGALEEAGKSETNSITHAAPASPETNSPLTQSEADEIAKIMPPGFSPPQATNIVAQQVSTNAATNAVSAVGAKPSPHPGPHPDMAMMGMMGMPGMGKKLPDLSIEAKALVNRIVDSELLGPVIHPMPMGLLGIAGNYAFLRSASGQTGMVKEGDSLGDLKLLKIGINRVLVEQDGEKKELTIFDGYGGESLLPKPKETHDESAKK